MYKPGELTYRGNKLTSCGIEKIKISGGPACPRQKQSTTVEFELTLVSVLEFSIFQRKDFFEKF